MLLHPAKTRELNGGAEQTTNNRMELTAAIEALRALKAPCVIDFYSDSEYVIKGITERYQKWVAQGRFAAGEVANADLWHQLWAAVQPHEITWHWVRGHTGNQWNERADQLATEGRPKTAVVLDASRTRIVMVIAGKKKDFGYAAAITRGEDTEIVSGALPEMTPNLFAIRAATAVLQTLPVDEPVYFLTNNGFLFDGITKWIHGWKKRGFKKFREEWLALDAIAAARDVEWVVFKNDNPPPEVEWLQEPLKNALK